jgi:hypothetical protein
MYIISSLNPAGGRKFRQTRKNQPKPTNEVKERALTVWLSAVDRFKEAGINITEKTGLSSRFTVIDEHLVWYGSINPLGFTATDDNVMRLDSDEVASALIISCF